MLAESGRARVECRMRTTHSKQETKSNATDTKRNERAYNIQCGIFAINFELARISYALVSRVTR